MEAELESMTRKSHDASGQLVHISQELLKKERYRKGPAAPPTGAVGTAVENTAAPHGSQNFWFFSPETRSLNELRVLVMESKRHSRDLEKDLTREVHRAEWKMKEQKLEDDIKTLREQLLLLVGSAFVLRSSLKPMLATLPSSTCPPGS